ncbi:MAG: VWA domain-containing protein [Thermoleophilaceae bacterium]
MSFAAPVFLLGLLAVPLAIAAYLASRGRAKRYAVRFTATPALKLAAAQAGPSWHRHLPAAAALAALAALTLALAQPQRTVAVPAERASIVLVTDHSRSMLATDIDPDRLTASKRAARIFLDELPERFRVGAVTFSGAPDAVQAPSRDHDAAASVIEGQVADGPTATGDALQTAVDALQIDRRDEKRRPAAIILLSDGKTTTGRDPVGVARAARKLRIPISTVSLGTEAATVPSPDFGPPLPAIPDPETLAEIARASGGRAFSAEDDEELSSIYKSLGSQLGTREEKRETTSAFAIGGLVLLLGAAAASVRSRGLVP